MAKKSQKFVIVRTYSAGVNFGELVSQSADGKAVVLRASHKIWRWRGANTLHELALRGASMTEYTRISEASPGTVTLTEAIEVIECSQEASANLSQARWM